MDAPKLVAWIQAIVYSVLLLFMVTWLGTLGTAFDGDAHFAILSNVAFVVGACLTRRQHPKLAHSALALMAIGACAMLVVWLLMPAVKFGYGSSTESAEWLWLFCLVLSPAYFVGCILSMVSVARAWVSCPQFRRHHE